MRPLRRGLAALAAALLIYPSIENARAHEPAPAAAAPGLVPPSLVERVEPEFPAAARAANVGGVVELELSVDDAGHVTAARVLRPAGFGFDEAARAAALQFHFRPATRDGQPIASTVLFEQRFTLRPRLVAETSATPPAPPPAAAPPREYASTVVARGATTAASSETIRNLDFDLRPKTSPNDLLRVVPGLLAVQHQGGGKADQLFLRGFDADHGTDVAVLLDGVPINLPSHAHGQGFTDLHFLIPEAIDRIDVIKGPYDVRFGDFATAGVVHLHTRTTFDSSSVSLTLGGYPTLGCASFPGDCKPIAQQRLVGVAAPKLGGWAEKLKPWIAVEVARDDGPIAARQELLRWNLFAKLSYDPTPSTTMGVFFTGYGSGWRSSGQIPSREVDAGRLSQFGAIDPTEGGNTQRYSLNAFFRYHEGRHELLVNAWYTRYRMALWNNFTFFLVNPERGDEIEQDDDRHATGLNLTYHVHARWRSIAFRTTVGAQLRWDSSQVDLWDATARVRTGRHVDSGPFAFGNDSGVSVLNLAAFVEEDVVFNRYVRAILGLRGDLFDFAVDDRTTPAVSGTAQRALASPKATLVITPARPLDLYLNFGMGFHSNDARIAVQEGRETPRGSVVNTVPRFYGGELGARVTLWRRLSIAAALWASYLENETVFVGDAGAFEPSDPTRRFGVDGELRLEALPWLFFDLDVAYANATSVPNRGNGGAVALAPRLYLTGGVTVRHPVGVRAGLRFRYLGPRPAFETSSEEYQTLNPTDPRRVNAEGWFVVDLYGAYRYRWFEVAVAIQNLLNADWREAQFGNRSCTREELTTTPLCSGPDRVGVADVHFTPGVPFNLQLTVKAYF